MIALTFIVAVVNISLGFWLAIWLGFGPPTLTDAWDALVCFDPSRSSDIKFLAATDLENHLDDFLDGNPDTDDFDLECIVLDEAPQDKEEEIDYDTSDMLNPIDPEFWNLSEKFVETSILKLVIAAIKNGVRMTSIDTTLRESRGKADRSVLQESRDRLLEDCHVYLEEQKKANEELQTKLGSLDHSAVVQEVNESLETQTEQFEAVVAGIEKIDLATEPDAGEESLIDALNQLRVTRHQLLDIHNELFLELARSEGHLDAIDSHLLEDSLTKLHNRIGIETTFAKWFGKKRHQSRQLNAAIFDIHRFTEVNHSLGTLIGDKILVHLAKELRSECGADDLVGRFAGQQFLVVYSDIGPQAALKKAEMFRQTIQESTFLIHEESCSLELNLAFTEIKISDESEQKIIQRLLEALDQSKAAGPAKSFMHDGIWANPIEPPPLKIKPKTFKI